MHSAAGLDSSPSDYPSNDFQPTRERCTPEDSECVFFSASSRAVPYKTSALTSPAGTAARLQALGDSRVRGRLLLASAATPFLPKQVSLLSQLEKKAKRGEALCRRDAKAAADAFLPRLWRPGAFRRRTITPSLFRFYYDRGDLPVSVDHCGSGEKECFSFSSFDTPRKASAAPLQESSARLRCCGVRPRAECINSFSQ